MASKFVIVGVVTVALVLGAAGALAVTSGSQDHVVSYITSPVAVQDVESTVLATGTLEPSNIVDVGAQTSGQLQSLTVKVGDVVTKGQKIGQIDATLLTNLVNSARNLVNLLSSDKTSMQAQLASSLADVNRQKLLLDQGIGTPAQLEKLEAAYKSMQANVVRSENQNANYQLALDAAQANLEKANVRAPIDGMVAEILINEGATINTTNQVQVIMRIAKMDTMTVRAQINEADVMKISNGQPVYFTVLGEPDVRYYGKLRQLGFTPSTGQLDPSKGSAIKNAIYYNALLDLPNKDGRLRPGMTAVVHLVLGEAKQALTIPTAAFTQQLGKDRYVVKVMDDKGEISERQITTGLADKLIVQVKSGLKAGEKVVVGEAKAKDRSGGPTFTLPDSLKG